MRSCIEVRGGRPMLLAALLAAARPAPLVLALALALLAAASAAGTADDRRPTVHGWTEDGVYLAYTSPEDGLGENDEGVSNVSLILAQVLDGRTGMEERYVLKLKGNSYSIEEKRDVVVLEGADKVKYDEYKTLPNKAAFTAWRKQHPARCLPGRTSPDGKSTVDIQLSGDKRIRGRWAKSRYTFEQHTRAEDMVTGLAATLTMVLVREGRSVEVGKWSGKNEIGELNGDVSLCWSPDGRRVAFIVHRAPGIMRDPGDTTILIAPGNGTRIQLVADPSTLSQAAQRVGAALDAAGFVTTAAKEARQATPRPATIIYAAAGFEQAAAAMAKAIPGGATVAKLDWKPPFDLVVAIGTTALGGK